MSEQMYHQTQPLAFSSASAAASLGWAGDRCIRSAPNHLECSQCIESCPAQALFFVEENDRSAKGQRLVVSDACHGCGVCLPSCPTEAILSGELQHLDQRISTQGPSIKSSIACHRVDSPESEKLHCLRAIGIDQIQHWLSQSTDQSISLCVAEDCQECDAAPVQQSKDRWWDQMQALNLLQTQQSRRPYSAAQGGLISRRRFFSASRPQSPVYAADDSGVRARRLQRYFAVKHMPLPLLQLDQHLCDASGVCSKVCPTTALQLSNLGTLVFNPLDCIECGFCISHCPQQALTAGDTCSSESIELRKSAQMKCFECGRAFSSPQAEASSHSVCPACHREKNLLKEGFSQLFG